MDKWNKTTDVPIPIGVQVLVTGLGEMAVGMRPKEGPEYFCYTGVSGYEYDTELNVEKITHWMPLPALPQLI